MKNKEDSLGDLASAILKKHTCLIEEPESDVFKVSKTIASYGLYQAWVTSAQIMNLLRHHNEVSLMYIYSKIKIAPDYIILFESLILFYVCSDFFLSIDNPSQREELRKYYFDDFIEWHSHNFLEVDMKYIIDRRILFYNKILKQNESWVDLDKISYIWANIFFDGSKNITVELNGQDDYSFNALDNPKKTSIIRESLELFFVPFLAQIRTLTITTSPQAFFDNTIKLHPNNKNIDNKKVWNEWFDLSSSWKLEFIKSQKLTYDLWNRDINWWIKKFIVYIKDLIIHNK